jgi:transmembrane sensor
VSTGTSRSRPNRQILEEASVWFVDFRVGDVDAQARESFRHWLQRSPEHIRAYLEIAGTYAVLPDPSPGGTLDVQALIEYARSGGDRNIVPLDPVPGRQPRATRSAAMRERRGPASLAVAIAASILVVSIAGLSAWFYTQRGTYSTLVGEQRSLTLSDGSTVELNSHSKIRVRYSQSERHIDLLEGQALFHVAQNKEQPFIVRVGATQVRAVGTQFDVYRRPGRTVVTVVEGRVAVVANAAAEERGRPPEYIPLLAAGEQITVTPRSIEKPVRANVAAAMAWTAHQLIFDGTPLAEVAEEFNRYNSRRLVVDEQALRDFHVSGTYSSTNADSLLRFLRVQPGIKLTETEREIRVTRD